MLVHPRTDVDELVTLTLDVVNVPLHHDGYITAISPLVTSGVRVNDVQMGSP